MNHETNTANTIAPAREDGDVLAAAENGLIELFGDLCHRIGLPRSYGQIYGLAFVSATPVSFDDVVSSLGLSKGSASQGLRWLREMGILRRAEPPAALRLGHARREFFVPLVDISALLGVIVRERMHSPLETGKDRLAKLQRIVEDGLGDSGDDVDPRGKHLRRQIRRLASWHRKTSALAPILLRMSD